MFDAETNLPIENVEVITTGQMHVCDYEIYLDDIYIEGGNLPVTYLNEDLVGGNLTFNELKTIIPIGCTFSFDHIIDGNIELSVIAGSTQTHIFSDGLNLTVKVNSVYEDQATQLQLTDVSGEFILSGILDDNFDLNFYKLTYDNFEFGPIAINTSNPVKTDRIIPDGILMMYPDSSGPVQPSGSISGYIQDTTGDPIENATVEVYFDGILQTNILTDATGFFNVSNLEYSGTYTLEFSAENYLPDARTVNLDLSIQPNLVLPLPIQLTYIGDTANIWGYVKETGTGDPIQNALVYIPTFDLEGITNVNGLYNISNVPINFPIDIDVYAVNYFYGGVGSLVIPVGGREYNFTLTIDPSYILKNGTLEGFVFGEDGSPLESATIQIAGLSNTTNGSGYYIINNVPEGINQQATARRSNYDTESAQINIFNSSITVQNFTLEREDDDGDGGNHGSSSNGSPPSSSAQSITPPHSSLETEYVDGCPISIDRDIEREEDKTTVTLEITNECDKDVENFELREYLPEEAVLATVTYSVEPTQIYLQPFVLIWEISELQDGETMTFVYIINMEIESNDFEARIYSTKEETEPIQTVELLAPKSAFIGDNITLIIKSEQDLAIPNAEITVTSPFGKEETLITDENGKAYFVPEVSGEYKYKIKNAILKISVSTKVNEVYVEAKQTVTTDIDAVGDNEKQLGLIALFGELGGGSWLTIIVLGVAVLSVLGIIMYFTSRYDSEPKDVKPEIHIEEEQRPIFDEINKRQIKGDKKTILEEIKRRQINGEDKTILEEIKKREVKPKRKTKAKKVKTQKANKNKTQKANKNKTQTKNINKKSKNKRTRKSK